MTEHVFEYDVEHCVRCGGEWEDRFLSACPGRTRTTKEAKTCK